MGRKKLENAGTKVSLYLNSEAIKVLIEKGNKSVFASEAIIEKGKRLIEQSKELLKK